MVHIGSFYPDPSNSGDQIRVEMIDGRTVITHGDGLGTFDSIHLSKFGEERLAALLAQVAQHRKVCEP